MSVRLIISAAVLAAVAALCAGTLRTTRARAAVNPSPVQVEQSRIRTGLRISPVPMNLRGKNRALAGLGSYIVNAQGGCNDCHTNPSFAPGGDPFQGEPEQINTENFLAGGRPFGPIISANITPDENGLPGGLTLAEFGEAIRTGHDPDNPEEIMQVMPWPVYRKMTNHDLRAVYEYLRSIPHAEPGGPD